MLLARSSLREQHPSALFARNRLPRRRNAPGCRAQLEASFVPGIHLRPDFKARGLTGVRLELRAARRYYVTT
jgi:hypothetical protein